jgi:arylsulfatase A-like enzyme/Tfp pilus assembly protein PilF
MRRVIFPALALSLLTAVPAPAQKPNVILITLDTTRADRMGFLGSQKGLTPHLDAVARDSVVFTRAYAQAPITTVSHATLFTGTYPQFHKVNDFGKRIPASLPVLAELFQKQGYKTAAFVGSIILDPNGAMAPGFDRGFDSYTAGYRRRNAGDDRYKTMERRAEETVARALAWLRRNSAGPFFLWIHIWDPHEPYEAPAPFRARFPKAPYDAEIAYSDAMLGRLFSELRARQLYAGTAIAITADHGESLGAHGENSHGIFLYDETIHVPLLLKLPAGKSAGQRVTSRVGLVDLAPSLLDMAGIAPPAHMQGQTLVRTLGRADQPDRPSYAETDYPRRAFGWSSMAAWRSGNYLYIRAPRPELYDTAADPAARKDISARNKSQLDRAAAAADDFRKRSAGTGPDAPDQPLDPKLAQQLSALGYASAGGRGAAGGKESGLDPKDKIQVANLLHDAQLAVEDGRTAAVVPLLEKVVTTDPQIFIAQLQLGMAYARQRNHPKAIPALRAATEIQPDAAMAHYELGLVLFRSGDLKTSAAHFEIAAGQMPKWADAHFSLASVWARSNRVPDAVERLRLALELDTEHYQANLLLGRITHLQGNSVAALPYLEKAAASEEASAEAFNFLAEAYDRAGRAPDAVRARAQAAKARRPGAAAAPPTP